MAWFSDRQKEEMRIHRRSVYERQKQILDESRRSRDRKCKAKISCIPINKRLSSNLRSRLKPYVKDTRQAISLLGCSIEELKVHLESGFYFHRTHGVMSWDNYGEWEIDHIKPLASFNLKNTSDLAEALHFSNLQPLWRDDNQKKGGSRTSDLF